MKLFSELAIPLIICGLVLYGVARGTDVFSAVTYGAEQGLKTVFHILPALILLLPCVYMLRASGVLEALCQLVAPAAVMLGIPPETLPLMLLRPLSGSGALAIGSEIMQHEGVNSFAGRCAAVMLGSTETTFYVIAIYFGAAGIKKSRHAIPAALIADFVGFLAAAFFVRLFFGA